jgi:hypothetical protein
MRFHSAAQMVSISFAGTFSLVKSSMAIRGLGVRLGVRVAVVAPAPAGALLVPVVGDLLPEGGLAAAQTRTQSNIM